MMPKKDALKKKPARAAFAQSKKKGQSTAEGTGLIIRITLNKGIELILTGLVDSWRTVSLISATLLAIAMVLSKRI